MMRSFTLSFVLLLTGSGFAFWACNVDSQVPTESDPATGGGGGRGDPATGGRSSGGTACDLFPVYQQGCDPCLRDECCSEIGACVASAECIYCAETDPSAPFCDKEPQRSLSAAVQACARAKCTEACAHDPLGFNPGVGADLFCKTVGPAFCDALFACCTDPKILKDFGGALGECKAKLGKVGCFSEFSVEGSYADGLRGWLLAGQTILDQAQVDMCVAELKAMAAGGAACVNPPQAFFELNCMTAFKGQIALGDACSFTTPPSSPLLRYSFIPCKEGRCEGGKCIPTLKVGDLCVPGKSWNFPSSELCAYFHHEECSNYDPVTQTYTCAPKGETGDSCTKSSLCRWGNCDATGKCPPPAPEFLCR